MSTILQFRPLTAGLALICSITIFAILWNFSSDSFPQPNLHSDASFDLPYGSAPFAASWTTWFSPQLWKDGKIASKGGKVDKNWNILYHLGGTGPWVQKIDGVVTNNVGPPPQCKVEQVHMLSRHGERYPTKNSGARILEVVEKLQSASIPLSGDFGFVSEWSFFVSDPEAEFEQLTSTGPFSGTLETFATGVKFRTRYRHLVPKAGSGRKKLKVWASDSDRVKATARYLASGLFGLPLADFASVEVIPETPERGADTLTPSEACFKYRDDEKEGHEFGDVRLKEFQAVYLTPILDRFRKQLGDNSNVNLTLENVYSMQEMCGFETTIRGKSPWCDLFTVDEWESFEYARDLYHFYRSGPGNKYSKTMGSTWLNATTKLLSKGPSAGPFFLSFSHDSDMIPTFSLLDLFHDDTPLPTTHVAKLRKWKTSQVVPMGGRLVIERLSCEESRSLTSTFVRLNINDGIVALPGCTSGPGSSCPLDLFLDIVQQKLAKAEDFRSMCGLPKSAPDGITFLNQD